MKSSAAIKRDRVILNIVPIVIGCILLKVVLSVCSDSQLPDPAKGLSISSTLISVWATCLGFMITAVSILLALDSSKYIEMLKATGHYKTILICLMICCSHVLVAFIIALVITFVQEWSVLTFAVMCASTIDVLTTMLFSLYFLWKIVIKY